jgi:hypothetical protein
MSTEQFTTFNNSGEFTTDILQQPSSLPRGELIRETAKTHDSSHHAFHAYPNHNRVKK